MSLFNLGARDVLGLTLASMVSVMSLGSAVTLLSAGSTIAACSRSGDPGKPIPTVPGRRCVIKLHGKSGNGAPTEARDGVTYLRPAGNAEGWGGRQWLYFPEHEYEVVRDRVAGALASEGCDRVVVSGFSNGAAAAAKMYCRGETFGGHVVGYVIDDPVVDHGVDDCTPPAGITLKLYWTGALARAVDGWPCKEADWTCEGGSTIGLERYAGALRVDATPSPHTTHEEYLAPPEYAAWLPAPGTP